MSTADSSELYFRCIGKFSCFAQAERIPDPGTPLVEEGGKRFSCIRDFVRF